jgi:serine/threonine protein phosphatase PrpC
LIDELRQLDGGANLCWIEYVGKDSKPTEVPPLRVHVLDSSNTSFSARFGVGYSATLGDRPTMEDCVTFKNYNDTNFLCGVFDGHSGHVASSTAVHCFQEEVHLKIIDFAGEPPLDVSGTFGDWFATVNDKLRLLALPDGCTVAVALVRDNIVYTAGIGDSRIVRVRRDAAMRLTVDNKANARKEYERLRECGLILNTEGRTCRKLGVARALGDFWCGSGLFVKPQPRSFEIVVMDVGNSGSILTPPSSAQKLSSCSPAMSGRMDILRVTDAPAASSGI